MTYKSGFEGGLIVGFVAFLFLVGFIQVSQYEKLAMWFMTFLAVLIMPLVSLIIGIGTIVQGHAILGTTGDGIVFGFTTAMDIPYIMYLVVYLLRNGYLPLPW
jgi:hypothetical protein